MTSTNQDGVYLTREADAFFERNNKSADPGTLRPYKQGLLSAIDKAGLAPKRVVEFGCNYGDLLAHFKDAGADECHGVEPSAKAVAFGREHYAGKVELHQGTMEDNPLAADEGYRGHFDLIVIDDVLCWVSRETLFQSLAVVDSLLADGGHLFIREFLPLRDSRNANHHVREGGVYCYKPAGPHYRMFTASGIYAVVQQEVWMDKGDAWAAADGRMFESRWSDVVLRKSYSDYFA